jgi:hypothetical protein
MACKYSAQKASIWDVRSWNGGMLGLPGSPSNNDENTSTMHSAGLGTICRSNTARTRDRALLRG